MFMLGKVRYPDIEGMNILLICPDEKSLSFSKNSEEEEDAGLFDNNIHALYGTRETSSGVSANAVTLSLSGTRHPLGCMQKFQALHPSRRAQVAQHPRFDPAMVYNLGIIVVPLNTVELSMILHPVTRIPPWMTCTDEDSPEEAVHADTEGSQSSSSCANRRLCRFTLSLNIMLNLLWREEDPVLRHSTDKVKDKHKSNQIQRALILLLFSVVIDPICHEWLVYVFSGVIRTHDGDCVSMD
mmetsp:Transcript_11845/g.23782  ORF Transcript_11845/g.23782 Transcript_11845/m.23782 type:complete len:241 (-) Transcript_11845:109-831(-)